MTTKTEIKIVQTAIENTIELIEDMKKNHGNHFIIEFIFDYEKDSLKTRLVDVTINERPTEKKRKEITTLPHPERH